VPPLTWQIDWSLLRDPNHWFEGNPPPPSGYYLIAAILCALALVAIAVFYYRFFPRWRASGLTRRLTARFLMLVWPGLAMILLLILVRFIQIPPFSGRWLTYIAFLYLLGVAGYFVWYRIARYPADRRKYELWRERQHYMPRARPKPGTPPSVATRRPPARKQKRRR
jgi:hypothetical protein